MASGEGRRNKKEVENIEETFSNSFGARISRNADPERGICC